MSKYATPKTNPNQSYPSKNINSIGVEPINRGQIDSLALASALCADLMIGTQRRKPPAVRPTLQLVEIVRPLLHHAPTLGEVLGVVVGGADFTALASVWASGASMASAFRLPHSLRSDGA